MSIKLSAIAPSLMSDKNKLWYHSLNSDLYVWLHHNSIVRFEFCYSSQILHPGLPPSDHSVSWDSSTDSVTTMCIDEGSQNSFHRRSPTLFACCSPKRHEILSTFRKINDDLPSNIRHVVEKALLAA